MLETVLAGCQACRNPQCHNRHVLQRLATVDATYAKGAPMKVRCKRRKVPVETTPEAMAHVGYTLLGSGINECIERHLGAHLDSILSTLPNDLTTNEHHVSSILDGLAILVMLDHMPATKHALTANTPAMTHADLISLVDPEWTIDNTLVDLFTTPVHKHIN